MVAEIDSTKKLVKPVTIRKDPDIFIIEYNKTNSVITESTT